MRNKEEFIVGSRLIYGTLNGRDSGHKLPKCQRSHVSHSRYNRRGNSMVTVTMVTM